MIAAKIKIITAREIFSKVPSVKKELWGGEFWTDGYFFQQLANMQMKMSYGIMSEISGVLENTNSYIKQNVVHHEQLTLF